MNLYRIAYVIVDNNMQHSGLAFLLARTESDIRHDAPSLIAARHPNATQVVVGRVTLFKECVK